MRGEQDDIAPLSEAAPRLCSFCCDELRNDPAVKCTECVKKDVLICTSCFRLGAQAGEHLRGHNYTIIDPVGPKVFEREGEEGEEWGCYEDLNLLSSFIKSHLDQWPERSRDSGCRRSVDEALRRIDKYFIQSPIGEYVLAELQKEPLKLAEDESAGSELPATHNARSATENGVSRAAVTPLQLRLHEDAAWGDQTSPPHSPISDKRLPLLSRTSRHVEQEQPSTSRSVLTNGSLFNFEDEDSDSTDQSPGQRNSPCAKRGRKSPARSPLAGSRSRLVPKAEQQNGLVTSPPAFDDEESRQSMLEQPRRPNQQKCGLSEERLVELRAKFHDSHFYNGHYVSCNRAEGGNELRRLDEEDLQLLAYMPRRDEFEHEYKNDAERLVSNIVSVRESDELHASSDKFSNDVKLARIRRYNRILKSRETRRNIVREHRLVVEYLGIVKNNLSERGRYNVLDEAKHYFNSKQREDYFKPLFFQLRQVADRKAIDRLAESIGKMESLKDQIDELQELQRAGIKELKGKLRVDTLPGSWSRKRRVRKVENSEQRKAGLRWKRIKRWSKKQGVSNSENSDAGGE